MRCQRRTARSLSPGFFIEVASCSYVFRVCSFPCRSKEDPRGVSRLPRIPSSGQDEPRRIASPLVYHVRRTRGTYGSLSVCLIIFSVNVPVRRFYLCTGHIIMGNPPHAETRKMSNTVVEKIAKKQPKKVQNLAIIPTFSHFETAPASNNLGSFSLYNK